jgi:intracellular sulfur oxidation DsrE/DsrF family protein
MFNLDEALRNHLSQRQKEPKVLFVAASVATLSPRSRPDEARVVAGVAGVATLRKTITSTAAIIQWLKEEGAHLYVADNTLCFRPTDWAQLAIVSVHWRALLHDLTLVDQEQKNGSGR